MRVCSSGLEEVSWLGVFGRRRLPGSKRASGINVIGLAAHSCGGSAGIAWASFADAANLTGFPVLKLATGYWIGWAKARAGVGRPILAPPPA
jgi:hypothetical protein